MSEKIGKYDIIERIGRGGMGMVYKARDPRLNRYVALKVISPDVEITEDLRTRFIAEAQACAGLRHQNIVTIFDVGEEDERVFIVMELLDGQELKSLIAGGVQMDLEEKIWVMIQLCDAIHYAHQQGIIHRDIKPGNVIVQKDGSVKVIDFGIAKMVSGVSATRTGLVMGTIRYMSLEQVKGKADARSDQYSLGAVFYEMLTQRPPYLGDQPYELLEKMHSHKIPPVRELAPDVPADLASIIEKATSRDAPDRYPDLAEMRADLEDVQGRIRSEADALRQKLAPRLKELRDVMLQFRQRVGGNGADEALPSTERTGRLKVLQHWDEQIDSRLSELRSKMDRIGVLEESVRIAEESLRAGRFVDAIQRCEAALAEVPEMAAASDVLERARQAEEAQQRQLLARKLIDDARVALNEGDVDLCLSILEQASEIPPPPEASVTIAALRQSANARREELARLQREAEQARAQVAAARRHAQGKGTPEEAAAAWGEAEASVVAAETALREGRPAEAVAAFGAALSAFQRFEQEAAEGQKRQREAEAQEAERRKREAERKRREAEVKEAERKRREAEAKEAEQKKRDAEAKAAERKKRETEAKEAERKKREAEARETERRQREAQTREEEKRRQQAENEASERRRREAAATEDDRHSHEEAPTRVFTAGAADPTWQVGPEDRTVVREAPRTGRRARRAEQGTPGNWQTAAMMSAVALVAFVGISGGIYLMRGSPSEPFEELTPGGPVKEAADKAAAERTAADAAAAEKAAADKAAAESAAADEAVSEKDARERTEAAKEEAARAEAEARAKTAAEERDRDASAARLKAEQEARDRSAADSAKAKVERADRERDAAARAKAEKADRDREAAGAKTEKRERDRAEAERAAQAREEQARQKDRTRTSQLEQSLDKAAAEAGASRRDALSADASRLATDLFGRGSAKQAEAKRFADSGNFDAAIAAQRDASSFFRQAQRQAEAAPGPKAPAKKPRSAVPAF